MSDTDITAMCLDFRQRKFILGDHNGTLNCYDFLNGANMKDFAYESCDGKAHSTEISKLAYCDEHATVISVSWDLSICIHDESEAEEGILLRRITNSHRADITALAYSSELSLIATGSADNIIKVSSEASHSKHNANSPTFSRRSGTTSSFGSNPACMATLLRSRAYSSFNPFRRSWPATPVEACTSGRLGRAGRRTKFSQGGSTGRALKRGGVALVVEGGEGVGGRP